jgi:hypothetical protein
MRGQRKFTLGELEWAACTLITQSLLYGTAGTMVQCEALPIWALRNKISSCHVRFLYLSWKEDWMKGGSMKGKRWNYTLTTTKWKNNGLNIWVNYSFCKSVFKTSNSFKEIHRSRKDFCELKDIFLYIGLKIYKGMYNLRFETNSVFKTVNRFFRSSI